MIRAWALLSTTMVTSAAMIPSAAWGAAPVVAIFDVEDKNQTLQPEVTVQLAAYLCGKMAEGGTYKVVPSSTLKSRLKDQKQQSYQQCYDQSCQIAIGRELAAQKSLSTQILKLGSRCVLMSTLYDLKAEASERSASVTTACGQDELLEAIDNVVARLRPAAKPRPTPSASAQPPRPPAMTLPVTDRREADESRSSISTWKWITGAAALAGISAGIVFATQASQRARDLETLISEGNPSLSQPTKIYSGEMSQLEQDYSRLEKASIAMFAVGGAMAVGSTLLFMFDRKPQRTTAVLPVVGPRTVGISGQVRF